MENEQSFHEYTEILRPYLPFAESTPLEPSDSLAELGLDSLNTVALLVEIESALGVIIPDDALTAETFATVGSLWSVVSDLMDPANETGTAEALRSGSGHGGTAGS
ncbi:phosphopantetheine-binding protein [Plantactinospora sp. WMMC1484]|uniref:phosphopantetheine-binding protein n=1 Tax=Plantactinospora sp. WMMC1484 TaxID=3404122 RepID=UPI003BF5FBA4